MIVEMARHRSEFCLGLAVFVAASLPKTIIGELIIVREVETVLDQRRTSIGVITHAIPANPGVHERKCQDKNDEQAYFEPALLTSDWHVRISVTPLRDETRPELTLPPSRRTMLNSRQLDTIPTILQ